MSIQQSLKTVVRLAEPRDLDAIMEIETAGWPPGEAMRAERFKFASRIECRFVWVASDARGEVLGMLTAFRPRWARAEQLDKLLTGCSSEIFDQHPTARWESLVQEFGLSRNWHEATAEGTLGHGRMHNPEGDVVFLVGLVTRPESKGSGLARLLLQSVLAETAMCGARYALGYSRLPLFRQFPQDDVDSYLRMNQTDARGVRPLDPLLRFHWNFGAQPVRSVDGRFRYVGIPRAMHDDPESRGYGVLIVAPIGAAAFPLDRLS